MFGANSIADAISWYKNDPAYFYKKYSKKQILAVCKYLSPVRFRNIKEENKTKKEIFFMMNQAIEDGRINGRW